MKLLAWNIRHGGGARLGRIVEEITAHDADAIVLTEYRAVPGKELLAELWDRGWPHAATTDALGNENGIVVFSRSPVRRTSAPAAPEHQVRWLDFVLPEYGFGVSALHIMAAGSGKRHPANLEKVRFWNTVLMAAETRRQEPLLFVGDWNTGLHHADEQGKTYVCAEQFGRLASIGWTDVWRRHNPGLNEWTWYSTLKGGARGNGFRLDHAFASPSLLPRVRSCRYSHREREARISDHSILIVEIV
jgi:exonuclease III